MSIARAGEGFLGLTAALILLGGGSASAAGWGTIVPGESSTASVRAQYGEPSREEKQKVEGYDSTEWTYEGERAPAGMIRMAVEFGLLKHGAGYEPSVVRAFRLEPKPGVFTRRTVVLAWGSPDQARTQEGVPIFLYESGLVVHFDRDFVNAVSLWFTIQKPPEAPRTNP